MKITSLSINNFRGLRSLTLPTLGSMVLVSGAPASGKTSLLQSIAWTLGKATRAIRPTMNLQWPGLYPASIDRSARVNVDVKFTPEEIKATQDLFNQWVEVTKQAPPSGPSECQHISLHMSPEKVVAEEGKEAFFQFFGRFYIRQLIQNRAKSVRWFNEVGDVFWMHREYVFQNAQAMARKALARKDVRDVCDVINAVLPDLEFDGYDNGEDAENPLVFFRKPNAGNVRLELSELSDSERYVISLLGFCMRMHTGNSVVLIDDIDQHMDEELCLSVISTLQKTFPDTQFIASCRYIPEAYEGEAVEL